MAPVIVEDAVEVQFLWTIFGSLCENRAFFRCTPPITAGMLSDIGEQATAWVVDHYAPVCSDSVVHTGLIITDKSVDGGLQELVTYTHPGAATGGVTSNETSFAIKLTTGNSGRSNRGRWFMPPPAISQLGDSNHLGVTAANAYKAALQALISDMFASDYRMGVVSLVHNGVPVSTPRVLGYTVAAYTDLTLDSQRQRKPGFGS